MLEPTAMDKKNSTRQTSAPKGNTASDPKSKQDGPWKQQQPQQQQQQSGSQQGQQQGRGGRRRDGGRPLPDAGRRPAPQRNRCAYDKRPQPRNGQTGPNTQGQRCEVARSLQDDSVDSGVSSSVRKGCKKVNLNHLLKFTLAPREGEAWHHPQQGQGHHYQGHRSYHHHRPPKYSKEQFLQANCQFVVRESASPPRGWGGSDPDAPVDWGRVEEVRVGSVGPPLCPVCLGPPVAAKMTPCGHVYCWPCLLHYLALSDRPWRPCPICFQPFSKGELKSVVPQCKASYRPGDEITMCLMRRQKNGCLPVPASLWKEDLTGPFGVDDEGAMTRYQKVLTAGQDQVSTILDREEHELRQLLREEGDAPEACFVQAALLALQERRTALETVATLDTNANLTAVLDHEGNHLTQNTPTTDDTELEPPNNESNEADGICDTIRELSLGRSQDGRQRYMSSGSSGGEGNAAEEEGALTAEDLELPPQQQGTTPARDSFHYYQAADGQAVFLHALNVRMLARDYGALEHSPHSFTARIVEIEGASIDEEMRRRLRYLRHLPLTCEIQVVELKLEPPLVTQDTLDHFASDVEKRRRMRSKRARSEKRRDRLLAQEELRKQGHGLAARYNLDSVKHFPSCDPGPPEPTESSPVPRVASADSHSTAHSDPDGGSSGLASVASSLAEEEGVPRVSFAQMVQTHGASGATRASGTPRGQRPKEGVESPLVGPQLDSDGEEFAPAPQFQHSFSLALEEALSGVSRAAQTPDGPKLKSGSKKKKKNMTLLFATSMNRSK
ncbi:RING finger protein 10 [Ixodes scapularis]|uniref:RING finger protein 10 n=1 Tax=Ixodes scapularis TaxID=6945 RepID=UPI001C387654|nr:RING finger protein 10 [Ixodes scapularis]